MPGTFGAGGVEEQNRLLEDALKTVKNEAFQMKRCLDKNKLMDGLKHASTMLSELRTSLLSPKFYYQLYMAVCDEMRHLEVYLLDEFQKGRRIPDLYELVQYAGNIIPRLYLLITVGVVYMKTNEMGRREMLQDLVEMCRGVQHPLRGLFLRNYLLLCTRDVLPDLPDNPAGASSPPKLPLSDQAESAPGEASGGAEGGEAASGSVSDSVEFVLLNFGEMNKLWVRMQHQGHSRELERRERERRDLRILVGTNLVRLSQLESLDLSKYKAVVLPALLEQVVGCRDAIAQEYLLDSIAHVFSDEFHLATLSSLLRATVDLQPAVNIRQIYSALIDRLAQYATGPNAAQMPSDMPLFNIFSEYIGHAIDARLEQMNADTSAEAGYEGGQSARISHEDMLGLQVSLLHLVTRCHPTHVEYVREVFARADALLSRLALNRIGQQSGLGRELMKLWKTAVDFYASPPPALQQQLSLHTVLALGEPLNRLAARMNPAGRRSLACYFLTAALDSERGVRLEIQSEEELQQVLALAAPLLGAGSANAGIGGGDPEAGEESSGAGATGSGLDASEDIDWDEFGEEQCLLARAFWLCRAPSGDTQYLIIQSLKKAILANGSPIRWKYTLPPLIGQIYQLILYFFGAKDQDAQWEKKCTKLLQLVHQTLSQVHKRVQQGGESVPNAPDAAPFLAELILRLYLHGLLIINELSVAGFDAEENIAYEFFTQAMTIYEEEISDSKHKIQALHILVGTLEQLKCFNSENAENLRSQCALAATKLLKKPDQSRAVALCAHLFWSGKNKENAGAEIREEKRVLECLKKSTKIAAQCSLETAQRILLYTDLLSRYTFFHIRGNAAITPQLLGQLVDKINEELAAAAGGGGVSGGADSDIGGVGDSTAGGDVHESAASLEHIRKQFSNATKFLELKQVVLPSH